MSQSKEEDADFVPGREDSDSDSLATETDTDSDESEENPKQEIWPESLSEFFPNDVSKSRLNQASNLYQMFRSDCAGIPPMGKRNQRQVDLIKEALLRKTNGQTKEKTVVKAILKIIPEKRVKKIPEKRKNKETSSLSSSNENAVASSDTGVDFSSVITTLPRATKKRKKEESNSKSLKVGKVGETFPLGKTFFKDFKVIAHDKIKARSHTNDCVESVLDTQFYSIDVDSFIIIIKKQWGNQGTSIPPRYYLRFGRSFRRKGSEKKDETYTWDFPLHLIDVFNDQLKLCLQDFTKQEPTWFADMDAYLKKKDEKKNN